MDRLQQHARNQQEARRDGQGEVFLLGDGGMQERNTLGKRGLGLEETLEGGMQNQVGLQGAIQRR